MLAPDLPPDRFGRAFDLDRRMPDETWAANPPLVVEPAGDASVGRILQLASDLVRDCAARGLAGRLVLLHAGSPLWAGFEPKDWVRLLRLLQHRLAGSLVTAWVSLAARAFSTEELRRVEHAADLVLDVLAFGDDAIETAGDAARPRAHAAPAEFADFDGTLTFRRFPRAHGLAAFGGSQENRTWLIRRDRRKLVIERMHLPPEASGGAGSSEASGGSAEGSGRKGAKPAASRGSSVSRTALEPGVACRTGPSGTAQSADF